VDWERTVLIPKLGIPYENGGHVALLMNEAVIAAIDGIRPLPEVEVVENIAVQTGDGLLGSVTPPVVTVIEEI
jgi:hypothetical protein